MVICHISVFYFHLKLLIWGAGLLKVREVKGSEEDCRFDPWTGMVNVKAALVARSLTLLECLGAKHNFQLLQYAQYIRLRLLFATKTLCVN